MSRPTSSVSRLLLTIGCALVSSTAAAQPPHRCDPVTWARVVGDSAPTHPVYVRVVATPDGGCVGRLRVFPDHWVDLPLQAVRFDADTAMFVAHAEREVRFGGRLTPDGQRAEGTFSAGGPPVAMTLHRVTGTLADLDTVAIGGGVRAPFRWEIPDGWSAEQIVLPAPWLPALPLHGATILRSAPRFGDATQPGYWSYAFVWWLSGDAPTTEGTLVDALTRYYRGLQLAMQVPAARADSATLVRLTDATHGTDDVARFTGRARLVDPFGGTPVDLALSVRVRRCAVSRRTAIVVGATPARTADTPTAGQVRGLLDAFHCA